MPIREETMWIRVLAITAMVCALTACGGGGGGSTTGAGGGTMPPVSTAAVSVAVSVPSDPAPVGELRWFDMTVANAGPDTATNVVAAVEQPPFGLTLLNVSCTAGAGAVCPAVPERFTVASLPAGGTLRYRVFTSHTERGSSHFTARVSADNDRSGSQNHSVAFQLSAFSADLKVVATAPAGELVPGAPARYTMTVTNAGPDPAAHVVIHDLVDANQTLQGITCTATGGALCPASIGPAMKAPTMPVGSSLQFDVTALPWPGTVGPITNKLQLAALGDPEIHDNVATATARVALQASPGSLIRFDSDAGDFVGQGMDRVYDQANARLNFNVSGAWLDLQVFGDKAWSGSFRLPAGLTQFQAGTYLDLGSISSPSGGLSWTGDGRGCSSQTGWVIVDQAVYSGAVPVLIDLRFEQRCDGSTAATRGRVRWDTSDLTQAPPPIVPPPADLWRADAGAVPTQGSYLHLRREPYDPVLGRADTRLFTLADSVMSVTANGHQLEVRVNGDERWNVDFRTMNNLTQLQPGYYRGLALQENPTRGFLNTSLQLCDVPTGWVVVDDVAYNAGVLASIDLRFEQYCSGNVSALHGQLHWVAGETTQPPGPQTPPAGLWAPPAGSTPGSGNYVYLESDPGDFIGQGATRLFTAANSAISVSTGGIDRRARVWVGDDRSWGGEFYAMSSVPRLQPGFYFGVFGAPTHNPAKGGLSWSGDSRACNDLWGWFVVDSVSYSGDELASLDVRFEQHCEFMEPALRGKVHWVR
jgi:uncharacterized repeat protein (TIGR01451 family)